MAYVIHSISTGVFHTRVRESRDRTIGSPEQAAQLAAEITGHPVAGLLVEIAGLPVGVPVRFPCNSMIDGKSAADVERTS